MSRPQTKAWVASTNKIGENSTFRQLAIRALALGYVQPRWDEQRFDTTADPDRAHQLRFSLFDRYRSSRPSRGTQQLRLVLTLDLE